MVGCDDATADPGGIGLLRAMAAFSGYLFEGMGVPKVAFQLGVLRLLVIVPLLIPMLKRFGLAGAAITVTLGIAAQWLGGLVYLRRLVGIRLRLVAEAIWRPLWMTIVMSGAVIACTLLVDPTSVTGLLFAIACGAIVYGALSLPVLLALRRERFA